MKVFVSWSGELSHQAAMVLKTWLPSVIQVVEPFVSSEDLQKGVRWSTDVGAELEAAEFGIICLTPDNLMAPWLLFEAGALSKSLSQSRVSPLLIGVKSADVQGPPAQFQMTSIAREDVKKLVVSINAQIVSPNQLDAESLTRSFDKWWPDLEPELLRLSRIRESVSPDAPVRSDRQLIEEILNILRGVSQMVNEQSDSYRRRKALAELLMKEPAEEKTLADVMGEDFLSGPIKEVGRKRKGD